jgi:hypothetical protein
MNQTKLHRQIGGSQPNKILSFGGVLPTIKTLRPKQEDNTINLSELGLMNDGMATLIL